MPQKKIEKEDITIYVDVTHEDPEDPKDPDKEKDENRESTPGKRRIDG